MIAHSHTELVKVIESSLGNPTNEKIKQVIESHNKENRSLIGAFYNHDLIGCIGFEIFNLKEIIIRHISVLEEFRRKKLVKK